MTENTETTKPEIVVEKSKHSLVTELSMSFAFALLLGGLSVLLYHFGLIKVDNSVIKELTYSEGKTISYVPSFLGLSTLLGFLENLCAFGLLFLIRPSGLKPDFGKKGKNIILFSILSLFGILAYLVISVFLTNAKVSNAMALFIASVLVSIYDTFIYKLYLENRTYSNALFWEIFRFAIVGLVAAVFDFTFCFLFQFVIFKGATAWYVTGVSTGMGFIVGVVINYLMSTYMVYKNAKTNTSKSIKGIVLFFVLALIGLFIGIGIQYLLYDLLNIKHGVTFFSYPVCFVLRTLIVMVYNYISRKLLIYR